MKRALRLSLNLLTLPVLLSCGSAPTAPKAAAQKRIAPLPPQAGYCEKLQPLLDKTVRAARIGTEISCLDVPGITDLGRFGPPQAGEESTLLDCFQQSGDYGALLHSPENAFQISIEEAFAADTRSGVGSDLTALVPWLPRVELANSQGSRLSATITIKDARFVTLVGVASKLQEQERQHCIEALCKPDYTYVHKALVGIPTVVLTAQDDFGKEVELGPLVANVSFKTRDLTRGAREISTTKPVTLAIARSAFRTAQTDRLCQFCGKRGQACCSDAPACDGGLGCIDQRCVEIGGPGQPCDGDKCSGGATCVRGSCRIECGGKGQPCCAGNECSGKLRCAQDPDNGIEHLGSNETVEVSGGFLGTSEDRSFGNSSCGALRKRGRFAVTKLGAGRGECAKAWWFDPKNDKDCRVGVHFNVSVFGDIQCRIEVFASAPPKPDICQ